MLYYAQTIVHIKTNIYLCGVIKKQTNMSYFSEHTHCSNFTCEIRLKCKRNEWNEYNEGTTGFAFAYIKKKKKCNHFIPK